MGRLMWYLGASRRRTADANMKLCLPTLDLAGRQQILENHFDSLGKALIETGMCWWTPDRALIQLSEIKGLEHLKAGLEKGNGVILLSAHFTCLELGLGLLLARRAYPIYAVYQKHSNPLLEAIITRYRGKNADGVIPHDQIRQMIRCLKENKVVWYAPDQAYQGKYSELVPFFDIPAQTNTATGRLAKLSGATVLPFFPRRLKDNRYVVEILPPMKDFPSGNDVEDTLCYHRLIEDQVRKVPDQYLWVHRRFKNRPPEYPDVYATD